MIDPKQRVLGSRSQEELVQLYSNFVSKPKADFFSSIGLGVIQGERQGIRIKMLGGINSEPPLDLIDCHTSGGVFNLGHHHPEIVKAIKTGLEAGLDIGDHHLLSEQRALLAEKLCKLLPGRLSKTMFSVGGGEAIDLAIKLARAYTNRTQVISATRAYHGVTGFALGASAESFRKPFRWDMPAFKQVPFGDINKLKEMITEKTAAILFETIPATGGILIPPEGYFAEVRELCTEKGIVMIADEVQAGLGRTGKMWAIHGGLYENEKIVPDILVLAKGMSAGVYPLSTTSYIPEIEDVFENDPFLHISTTGGSELGCFVAKSMLDIISKPTFLEHVETMGKIFRKGVNELQENYSKIKEVRGRGLMLGIEFEDEFTSLYFILALIKAGIFADYCGNHKATSKFLPPLIVTPDDINEILNGIEQALKAIV